MRAGVAEVRLELSEAQLWEISDRAGASHSRAGWERADAWAELNSRFAKWTQGEIATRAGKPEIFVRKCISLARKPILGIGRNDWADAWEELQNPHLSRNTGVWIGGTKRPTRNS